MKPVRSIEGIPVVQDFYGSGKDDTPIIVNSTTGIVYTLTDGLVVVSAGGGVTPPISRVIAVTTGNTTMGSAAATDYAYFVAGLHTMSLPSPNNNRYTVKNNHTANITVDTAGAELIEGVSSIIIRPAASRDLLSDGTNWYVV